MLGRVGAEVALLAITAAGGVSWSQSINVDCTRDSGRRRSGRASTASSYGASCPRASRISPSRCSTHG